MKSDDKLGFEVAMEAGAMLINKYKGDSKLLLDGLINIAHCCIKRPNQSQEILRDMIGILEKMRSNAPSGRIKKNGHT